MYRLPITLGISVFAAFVFGGAIAIYGFNYFEHAWGRFNSLQVYAWIGPPAGAIAGLGTYLASAASRVREHPKWAASLLIALGYVLLGTVFFFLAHGLIQPFGLFGLAVLVGVTAFVYAYLVLSWLAPKSIAA